MDIDYENYYIFSLTKNQIRKKYSEEIVNKYYKILAMLYQNGTSIKEEDIEETLMIFNNFKSYEDVEEYTGTNLVCTYERGKKILANELYDIIRSTTFVRNDLDNEKIAQTLAISNWDSIVNNTKRLNSIFTCTDFEIAGAINCINNKNIIISKLSTLNRMIERQIKVASLFLFEQIISSCYIAYIGLSKVKKDTTVLSNYAGIKTELYGYTGGYNPNTKGIVVNPCSAVSNLKLYYSTNDLSILKAEAKAIIKENKNDSSEDLLELEKWVKYVNAVDDKKGKQLLINFLLNGCLSLLMLKHNLNLIKDPRNKRRAFDIQEEFMAIMKYAGIQEDYLL